ncbi:hypothetical protein [Streptomyces sp. NPDC001635]
MDAIIAAIISAVGGIITAIIATRRRDPGEDARRGDVTRIQGSGRVTSPRREASDAAP